MEKGGLFAWRGRVQESGALQRHWDRPNGLGFRPASAPFGLELGWRKLGEGRNSVVASVAALYFPRERGKGEGAPRPWTNARSLMQMGDLGEWQCCVRGANSPPKQIELLAFVISKPNIHLSSNVLLK